MKQLVSKKELQQELIRAEPKGDLLHDLMGCGRYKDVVRTKDGFFLGMKRGSRGYNEFLGKPTDISKGRTKAVFEKLPNDVKATVVFNLFHKNIPLSEVGL
jgi:hypothetical protein